MINECYADQAILLGMLVIALLALVWEKKEKFYWRRKSLRNTLLVSQLESINHQNEKTIKVNEETLALMRERERTQSRMLSIMGASIITLKRCQLPSTNVVDVRPLRIGDEAE